jgi:ABC-2 type transport system ATP-binding protein
MRNVTPEQVAMAEQHRRGELPDRIEGALGELAGAAKEGLMALSVGVGLGVLHELMAAEVDEVVGPNGAGKSTTIRMLLGLITPTGGEGEVFGHPIGRPAAYLHRVGALIEAPAFYPALTGEANLPPYSVLWPGCSHSSSSISSWDGRSTACRRART